jgi:antitoxin component YwqK of YwqJK toxin-antitoxin module
MFAKHPLLKVALVALVALGMACASNPTPAPTATPPVTGSPSDPLDPNAAGPAPTIPPVAMPLPTGPTGMQRVASSVEGALLGTVLGGSIAGPIGAAAGAVAFAIYGAVVGDVPLSGGGGGSYPSGGYPSGGYPGYPGGSYPPDPGADDLDQEIEDDLERELARQDTLESEIEAELRRQEELLKQIEQQEAITASEDAVAAVPADAGQAMQQADPRGAPTAPADRDLPLSIFDEESRTVAPGVIGNDQRTDVLVRSLDADRDGAPEEIRYHDPGTGAIVHKQEDKDYDGKIDTWTTYEAGMPKAIEVDNDGDGRPDEWQSYDRGGRMAGREVDRYGDGTRDAFFIYQGDSLVEEKHDGDSNGAPDRIVYYESRKIARTEEDSNKDGQMDTWTVFTDSGGREVVGRVERDTSGDGRPDTFETYEQVGGKTQLKLREEDKNGDGTIDVKSIYENGKLKQREISDPELLPL